MKIIYNNILPFKGYKAMAFWPFIFVRGESISEKTLNHERIHLEQQKELLLIGFYVLYFIFWIIYGYRKNPFEREAYAFDDWDIYLRLRKKYTWTCHFRRRK